MPQSVNAPIIDGLLAGCAAMILHPSVVLISSLIKINTFENTVKNKMLGK